MKFFSIDLYEYKIEKESLKRIYKASIRDRAFRDVARALHQLTP